jgi:hypothetical protein
LGGRELVGCPTATLQHRIGSCGPIGISLLRRLVEWCIHIKAPGEFEITIFTTAFQGVGYLFMMALANVCYFLGPLSERIVRPTNTATYRKTAFRLGFWFSVLLPFMAPRIWPIHAAFMLVTNKD